MEYVIHGREPADALRFFEEISAIPRASRNEAGIAAYMKKFAEDRGLWVHVDENNNGEPVYTDIDTEAINDESELNGSSSPSSEGGTRGKE